MQFFSRSLRQNDVSFFVGRKSAALFLALLTVFSSAVFAASSMAAPFSLGGRVFTLAGDGTKGSTGDGGPATAAQLNTPQSVLALSDGSFLISDELNHRVRRVDKHGVITTFAGVGTAGHSGDGGPAKAAELNYPDGLALMPDGSVLIAESEYVRRVTPGGYISTFAGDGKGSPYTDGLPADKVSLGNVSDVVVSPLGEAFIADWNQCAVRIISPAGTMNTVAGGWPRIGCGYSGDGGTAFAAEIGQPHSLALGPDGSLYIVSQSTQRIRRIDPAGKVSTFAGQPTSGFSGDGGPAKNAELSEPIGVDVAPDGSVFVADTGNQRVRKINPAGDIDTYVGGGMYRTGGDPDGVLALDSSLEFPWGVDVLPDGLIAISDIWDKKVRIVTPTMKVPAGTP